MNSEFDKGGLKMIDIKTQQSAFLLSWAAKLHSHAGIWTNIPLSYFKHFGQQNNLLFFYSNTTLKNFNGLELIQSSFWKTVAITWLNSKINQANIHPSALTLTFTSTD